MATATLDPTTASAEDILSIPDAQPYRLFPEPDDAKGVYREMAKLWHPDQPGGNGDVFAKISKLYTKAAKGLTGAPDERVFPAAGSGPSLKVRYRKAHATELGEMLIGDSTVTLTVRRDFEDLFTDAVKIMADFGYGSDDMRKQMTRCLPEVLKVFPSTDVIVMIVRRPPGTVLLADLVEHLGGSIDPVHAAWIGSGLHNIACYLDWQGLTHNAISSETVFVDPAGHSVSLLGGWFYAAPKGKKMTALPQASIDAAPRDLIAAKLADGRLDLDLIRATGRRITQGTTVPPAMKRWFLSASAGDAIADYAAWKDVLRRDFGPPKFVELDVPPNAIY